MNSKNFLSGKASIQDYIMLSNVFNGVICIILGAIAFMLLGEGKQVMSLVFFALAAWHFPRFHSGVQDE